MKKSTVIAFLLSVFLFSGITLAADQSDSILDTMKKNYQERCSVKKTVGFCRVMGEKITQRTSLLEKRKTNTQSKSVSSVTATAPSLKTQAVKAPDPMAVILGDKDLNGYINAFHGIIVNLQEENTKEATFVQGTLRSQMGQFPNDTNVQQVGQNLTTQIEGVIQSRNRAISYAQSLITEAQSLLGTGRTFPQEKRDQVAKDFRTKTE